MTPSTGLENISRSPQSQRYAGLSDCGRTESNASAGVVQPSTWRGRWLSFAATQSS